MPRSVFSRRVNALTPYSGTDSADWQLGFAAASVRPAAYSRPTDRPTDRPTVGGAITAPITTNPLCQPLVRGALVARCLVKIPAAPGWAGNGDRFRRS
jgi:hypothetical protein